MLTYNQAVVKTWNRVKGIKREIERDSGREGKRDKGSDREFKRVREKKEREKE